MEGYKIRDQLRYNVVYNALGFVGGSNSPAYGTIAIKIANGTAPVGLSDNESRLFVEKYSGSLVIAEYEYSTSSGNFTNIVSVYRWPAFPNQVLYKNGEYLTLNWPAFASKDLFVNSVQENNTDIYFTSLDKVIEIVASLMNNIVVPSAYYGNGGK